MALLLGSVVSMAVARIFPRSSGHAGEPELHVLDGDEIVGMLSVNAVSGAVWYHSWHGRFIATDEPDGS